MQVVAKPENSHIYVVEKPRLAAAIQKQLELLKRNPSKESLAAFETSTLNILVPSIKRVMLDGFSLGAKAVEEPEDATIRVRVERLARSQALDTSRQISKSSGFALDIKAGLSLKRVASSQRADLIALDNLARAYFVGTRNGWALYPDALKSWFVHDMHDKDDMCDDNEADGAIPINQAFSSGAMETPAHIGCDCYMLLVKRKKPVYGF